MMRAPFIQLHRQEHELSGPPQDALACDSASAIRTSYAAHGEDISKEAV
jgi:hypothetical protein